ncbi:MAG TPA: hypothetical protein VGM56_05800 [Byssovorax sp.]
MSDACVEVAESDGAIIDVDDVLVVRRGPGANCSSIGSALDVLFFAAALSGVVLAVAAASFARAPPPPPSPPSKDDDARSP